MTAISKNVYFDVLDDIVDKYNNTHHTTIKMKPIDVRDDSFVEYNEESNEKDPKFKFGDHVRISKYKNIFSKRYAPNWSEDIFIIKKIKNTLPWTYEISDLNGEEIVGSFYEKELQKTNQKEIRIEKVIKRKGNKLYVKWKGYDNFFNSWIDKKDLIKRVNTFLHIEVLKKNNKVELDLSNYAIKTDLKTVTHVDVSSFASKANIASLKTEVDKIDADKLKTVPVDLAKLSNVVKNNFVKKTEYNSLKTKVHGIDTTNFVKKTKYEKDGSDFENKISKIVKKIPDVRGLVKKTDFNAKVTEIESKIPSISGLATNSPLTPVENKIPDVCSLTQKYLILKRKLLIMIMTNILLLQNTAITTTMSANVFNVRLPQANVITKTDFDVKLSGINKIITSNKRKHLLIENELKKSKKFAAAYFRGKSHFEEDGTQNYLVFQPI